jgi:hypothetical protein
MYISWDPRAIPEDAEFSDAVPTASSQGREAHEDPDIYSVSALHILNVSFPSFL